MRLRAADAPGTLYTIEIDRNAPAAWTSRAVDVATHGMNPMRVLQMAQAMGGLHGRILLVGCEPETLGSEEEGLMGLSATVAAAVEPAADLVEALVGKILEETAARRDWRCGVTSNRKGDDMAAVAMYRTGRSEPESNETRDTLFLLGGLSLILFGAGLVVTNPVVRKLLGRGQRRRPAPGGHTRPGALHETPVDVESAWHHP